MAITRLTQRKQFIYVARGKRVAKPNVVVQARMAQMPDDEMRSGFTATKKTGNAVRRNRAKRRLREASRFLLAQYGQAGWAYVFIARMHTADAKWPHLLGDMKSALQSLHNPAKMANASRTQSK